MQAQLYYKWGVKMNLISYKVNLNESKLKVKLKKNPKYIEEKMIEIIFKRKEKRSYENSSGKGEYC